MKINNICLTLLLSLFLAWSCTDVGSDTDTAAESERLMEVSREWSNVASTGNIDSILTYWADDAVMMPPGQPPLVGKEAIRTYVESSAKIPGFQISWEPVSAHVSNDGSMAYLIERNRISFNDSLGNSVTQHNKVVTVWRKDENGNWKNVIDMWNASPTAQ